MKYALAFAFAAIVLPLTARADESVNGVLSDWAANRTRFKSVRYTLSGTLDLKPSPAVGKIPATDGSVHPITATVLFDFAGRRFRIESTRPRYTDTNRNKWYASYKVNTFNGKAQQNYFPRDKNPSSDYDLSITSGDLRQHQFSGSYYPILLAHGFVPSIYREAHPHRLPDNHDPEEFIAHGRGSLEGMTHTILRTQPSGQSHDEYWIAPGRGGAVARYIHFSLKTNPWYRIDINNQLVEGAWLPKKWTFTWTDNSRTVVEVERVDVTRIEVNPAVSDEDFTIPITPGMIVKEHKYPDAGSGLDPVRPSTKTSRAKEGGGLEVLSEKGFTTLDGRELPPERGWRWWWISAAIALIVAVGAVWALRARRRAARSAE